MSKRVYMLDTRICSFIMREQPLSVLERLQQTVERQHRIVISAITYSEMRFGEVGKKSSPKHGILVREFLERIDDIYPWDKIAVDATTEVKRYLSEMGTPIGGNDTAIAGHAVASGAVLVTNNTREFCRVPNLVYEDWAQ